MTDRMAALAALSLCDVPERAAALDDFYDRYSGDPLIVDKWFALQASIPERATLDRVKALTAHPAFSFGNPNRVRALIAAFATGNQKEFNRPDGAGYDFVIDTVLALDPKNPAARRAPDLSDQELARARAVAARPCRKGAAPRGGATVAVARRERHRQSRARLSAGGCALTWQDRQSSSRNCHFQRRAVRPRSRRNRRATVCRRQGNHCGSSRKRRAIILKNSLTRTFSTNCHLSIPIESDSGRCGTSFR